MNFTNRLIIFFTSRRYVQYLLLLLITLSLFTYLQLDRTFADPDSFYHAKMAEILVSQGAITGLPWLSATTLKYNFVDHHFLYHLFLIPFVQFFSPLLGLKIATIIFASLAIMAIFWLLRQLGIKGAFWYVLFLLTVNPFIFRLNLAKAQGLVLVFLFLTIYLLLNRRYLALILVAGLYVWLYGGWPLVLVLAVVYGLANWFLASFRGGWFNLRIGKIKVLLQNFWLLISAALGLIAGLVFNPYFPKNLEFYWQQSFKIAVFNYQNFIGVGGEWYPYALADLFFGALPFFLLFILALIVFIIFGQKQSLAGWFFLVLSLLFLSLTLKSRRYVEYFIPLALCFSALSLNVFFELIKPRLNKLVSARLIFLSPLIILLALAPVFYRDLSLVKDSFRQGFSFDKFARASQWLKQNSSPGEIVFHSDWDEFPLLFYHNDLNYYLVGLDPTFMYEFDQNLHQRWVKITSGQTTADLYQTIKMIFGASYVFVDFNQNADFDRNLANNFYFEKVFEDQEARIYRIIE